MRANGKRAIYSLVIALVVALPASAEKSLLSRNGGEPSGVTHCCPKGLEGSERCLDLLSRDSSDEAAACAAVTGLGALKTANKARATGDCLGADRNMLGITTGEMRDKGWYQNDAP